ncbi:PQQ-dependent sugar dehydrogenase [Dyadobacter sp. CY343]|uniref:PQQ-dependent sugar dehydrogenase n=1 Tax=Dyadobacter sp. CY343 TaxID=2907299 RepID=UPI001F318179|nr:PQQ-dependent sugar dehydrogenase [Dyadobacter sp. CY343]MCE7060237.1 PQQ-dependent sugar dehydrogenase [Dyadobacter sp. CY343]
MSLYKGLPFYLLAFCFLATAEVVPAQEPGQEKFEKRVIAKGISDPWEIVFGPDAHLWVTESKEYRVLRVDPATGNKEVLADLSSEKTFPNYDKVSDSIDGGKPAPQGGLMGMALHPHLLDGKPFVYLAFVYDFEGKDRPGDGQGPQDQGFHFKTKIVRYTYNVESKKLEKPETVCDQISGSNDHNGGRLLISAINGNAYLFYSVGDMGSGQFKNAARTNYAQDLNVYEGKMLRFNTEPDKDTDRIDSWIPDDNPFNKTKQNAVWSLGHRNAQGLAEINVNGKPVIFSSEHGPFSDDEINIIKRGRNYGHPLVIGFADGNYNGLSAGVTNRDSLPGKWNTTYPFIENEQRNAKQLKNFEPPIKSFFGTKNRRLLAFADTIRSGKESPEWPSLAPSGIAAYTSGAIPGWKNSLLVSSLKQGKIVRLKLNATYTGIEEERDYFASKVRYRDVAVSADGLKIYAITDKSAVTSGPSGENPEESTEEGAIIEFTFKP